ncbi:putative [pyruvate dehydrogenase (acetyl-transferring)] kinase, mitochondrial [Trichinella pseudospiralis]|uniref:Protein-serine/threonine kinase n=1 Tax=Trichinella pseudospiralis TaxID=6337 RepID=A0A0V1IYQ8_TRIPS|nr:putative [pyruvate dehydrogenase (acetyl-transferring)] kinase, mitochondrial [Trichinella pseudospiralis]
MQFTRNLFSPLIKIIGRKIDDYAQFRPSALSMQSLVDFGKLRDERSSFEFLKKELLVRLANIMKEVELLPSQLMETPSTKLVYQWYQESFQELLQYENANADKSTLRDFSRQLSRVLKRHNTVVETMAEGLMEMKATHGIDPVTQNNIQYFLNRFYLSRISVRMLIYQHVIIFSDEAHPFYTSSRHIGCIDPNCNVVSIIEVLEPSQPISIVYVPSHLYHIMIELLKISDQGGGVPRHIVGKLFNYMYTTASLPSMENAEYDAPMAGLGYGLPLSRLYARYFLGDLFLFSMEGYGTDACLYLKASAVDASEMLPWFSFRSKKMYESNEKGPDWSV